MNREQQSEPKWNAQGVSPNRILEDGEVIVLSPANVRSRAYRGKFGAADGGCLLVSAEAAARMFDLSERSWYRLRAAGDIPASVQVGPRTVRWDVDELRAWNQAGRPTRAKWEGMKRNVGA